MGTTLSNLAPPRGARRKRKRIGRGPGSGNGTTAGKGQKGQQSRSGVTLGRGFEGGQMPLQRRLPKIGFKNIFRTEYAPVNIGRIAEAFPAGETVDAEALRARGLVPRSARLLKVLGGGQVAHALTIKAHAFSRSAKEKIESAGGKAEVVPPERQKAKSSLEIVEVVEMEAPPPPPPPTEG
jgi:large subunit ribosomal protein L15